MTDLPLTSESLSLVVGKQSTFLQGYIHRMKSIEGRLSSGAPKFKVSPAHRDSKKFLSIFF